MFTNRNNTLLKEIKRLQLTEADLLHQQKEHSHKTQTTAQTVPTTQHILESYPLEKNQLWKLVMKKATVYRSQDDILSVDIYPNLPK